ncbi:MAG: 3-deoxy-D-manno-octulosonic acid transferase [Verrucomicrobia bacterium]|nr:3-deoxy-D-manno-octulosonic acid transferase [Verrucomicrobiota bacterium]
MLFLLQLLFAVGFLLSSPFYLLKMLRRGNFARGFWQRFGLYSAELRREAGSGGFVWIQAVSVGETRVALLLIERLRRRWPDLRIALSTTTSTGQAVARKQAPPGVPVIYFPLDFLPCMNRAMDLLRPRLVIVVETEVWPTLVLQSKRRGVPVAMVNGRMSEKSYRGYRCLGGLSRRVFGAFDLLCAQGPRDAERFRKLGARDAALRTTGSLKFDEAQMPSPLGAQAKEFLRACGAGDGRPVWVCGSTHAGEEEIVFRVFRELRAKFPSLFLVLAPRHPERTREVLAVAQRCGVSLTLRSEPPRTGADCLLLNTTGELKAFYEAATVIFVGKSLRGRGGQNIIEAAATGAPVLFGPAMQNFEAIADEFVRTGAGVQVADEAALRLALEDLLAKPERRREIAERARQVIAQGSGAAERTVEAMAALGMGGKRA